MQISSPLDISTVLIACLFSRGLLTLQSKGNVDEAISLMQKALEIDEKCEFAYETLGTVGKFFVLRIN